MSVKERPILFSAPMIRALLAGTKTQTRRMLNERHLWHFIEGQGDLGICPYGAPGDRLWVRETHMDLGACYLYRADGNAEQERALVAPGQRWRPAIHMPRAASRITLEVTGVRVERLQEISDSDAFAEGIQQCSDEGLPSDGTARGTYRALWESINGPGSWDANPWVWVVEFRRV